ncbi:MAG TPA: ABC transporter ATP-binding protein [Anaerolineales bacterium]|nr:ABC transporter ATP-binding protein [Anaerolineales bacterium]
MNKPAVKLQNITKTFPGGVTAVDNMNLEISQGEFFTMLGPSGCGKTTTLRMIAGFELPTQGEIFIDGKEVSKVAPNHRPVNTVFQNYALFPHLTVEQNVAFGLRLKRVPTAEIQRRVKEALEMVQLPGMEKRKPTQLSGGQQQRVALARALINEPAVLLLDEPLGALDLKLRKAVQLELKQLQSELEITFVYVTHDQEEALTMSNRIAVMNEGVVQQLGTPREIYENPVNRFVADFIGETNFVNGTVQEVGEFVSVQVNGFRMMGAIGNIPVSIGQKVTVAIRPEKMNLYPPGKMDVLETEMGMDAAEFARVTGGQLPKTEMDMRQYLEKEPASVVIPAKVLEAIYIGTDIRYLVALNDATKLVVRMQNFGERYDTTFDAGDDVLIHWPAENARILTA